MPKGSKKGNGKSSAKQSDVTLNDFANCKVTATRLRKPVSNTLARKVKDVCQSGNLLEFETLSLDDEDLAVSSNNTLIKRQPKNTNSCNSSQEEENNCRDYPLDLWFLLADYIRPEDVKTFASLCKSAFYVIQTFKFWIGIYKRYYEKGVEMPLRLQPNSIERPYCLKVCVIRALYFMYPPFMKRISSRTTYSDDEEAYNLIQCSCISMWRIQNKNKWNFFFKFRSFPYVLSMKPVSEKEERNGSWLTNGNYTSSGLRSLCDDVNLNPDTGCKVLCVTCPHFIAISPAILGSQLIDARINLSHDLRNRYLQLTFSFAGYKSRHVSHTVGSRDGGGNGEVVKIDPVENIQVLNWWHPQYPSGNKF